MKAKLRVKCLHLTNVSCSPISSSSKKWSFKQPVFEPVCNKSNCSMYPPFICFCINMNSLIIWPKYHIVTHTRHQIANRGQTLPNVKFYVSSKNKKHLHRVFKAKKVKCTSAPSVWGSKRFTEFFMAPLRATQSLKMSSVSLQSSRCLVMHWQNPHIFA